MIDREIIIKIAPRPDGGLRVYSDDVPGLILSGKDPVSVMADVWPAILQLERYVKTGCHLTKEALLMLNYMRRESGGRGGFMFEGARPAFENGIYKDSQISELLNAGAIKPHEDPNKGWVVSHDWF